MVTLGAFLFLSFFLCPSELGSARDCGNVTLSLAFFHRAYCDLTVSERRRRRQHVTLAPNFAWNKTHLPLKGGATFLGNSISYEHAHARSCTTSERGVVPERIWLLSNGKVACCSEISPPILLLGFVVANFDSEPANRLDAFVLAVFARTCGCVGCVRVCHSPTRSVGGGRRLGLTLYDQGKNEV